MDLKRILIQATVGGLLFTVISVILNGNYGQDMWVDKGAIGLIFALAYGVFLVLKQKFINK